MDYNELPPFESPEGLPAPSALDSQQSQVASPVNDDEDYDSYLDADDSDDGDDEPDGDGVEAAGEADAGTSDPAVAALRQQLKDAQTQLDQWNAWNAQQEEVRLQNEQRAAEQYWDNALATANAQFAQKEQNIYREADQLRNEFGSEYADRHIRTKTRELFNEYQGYLAQFHADREAGIWDIVKRAALPGYAAEVAEYYGLGRDSINELLNYPPDLMPREAERMKRDRDRLAAERRKASQLARRAKNLEVGNKNVTPGEGRASSPDMELGSDDHYNNIPWQRM